MEDKRMRLRVTLAVMGGALLAVACSDSSNPITQPAVPSFLDVANSPGQIHVMPTRAVALGLDRARPSGGAKVNNTGIFYHGGPILAAPKVAAIYWGTSRIYNGGPAPGTTGTGGGDGSLVGLFLRSLGGSPYFNINTTYYDGSAVHVSNSVTYTAFWADNSSPGATPSDAAIQAEVVKAFSNGLPYDAATVYLVFTGSGVNLGGRVRVAVLRLPRPLHVERPGREVRGATVQRRLRERLHRTQRLAQRRFRGGRRGEHPRARDRGGSDRSRSQRLVRPARL
jgi:hypothetical protein